VGDHSPTRIEGEMNKFALEEPGETIYIYPTDEGIYITRDNTPPNIVDADPPNRIERSMFYIFMMFLALFLLLDNFNSFLLFQFQPTAIITIIPKMEIIKNNMNLSVVTQNPGAGEIQGRILPTLTISQKRLVKASGKGHQNASRAIGNITFYNGLLSPQSVLQGTILTGSDGSKVVTDETAYIPSANPPTEGVATVQAHAISSGVTGNIASRDIDRPCCGISILAVNLASFYGGQDARDFPYVTKEDIADTANTLKESIQSSVEGAFTALLQGNEALIPPTCITNVSPDRQAGDEATSVNVSVSENCTGVAYDKEELDKKAEELLNKIAPKGFREVTPIQISILQVTAPGKTPDLAVINLSVSETLAYIISPRLQTQIKDLIKGRARLEAIRLISSMQGIGKVTIAGTSDNALLPHDDSHLNIVLLYPA
jgi:hypothetical protein